MKRWEYTYSLADTSDDPVKDLNQLGRDGWEICAFEPDNEDHNGVFYLKREISEAQAIGRGACDEIELEINRIREATKYLKRERARCAVELEPEMKQINAALGEGL